MKQLKIIPKFKSEKDEREFWLKNSSVNYVDWSKAVSVRFTNLKPSTKSISIRLPEIMLDKIRIIANKMDVPYQSLIKKYIDYGIRSAV
ncbi:BrnA antitoxin family protein [Candidatus Amesbacteria bacterium]|nr:BrnA antitoxin family protein [Candidatus Amesbacteria bacterium]